MEPILRNFINIDWIILLLVVSIVLLAFAKSFFYKRFLNYIILPFNDKYIFMYNKKDRLLNWFTVLFTLFLILNLTLFIYLSFGVFKPQYGAQSSYIYFIIFAITTMFLTTKIIIQLANGFIFGSINTISEIIFKKLSYLNYSGFILLIANVLLLFTVPQSKIIIYGAAILFVLTNAIGWITALRSHQNYLTYNFFYFILYLCALEIGPVIIIGSYLKY